MNHTPQPTCGLLLMAYGSPKQPNELTAYLTHIRHGTPPSAALLSELQHRYRMIGGNSPLTAITEAQGKALLRALRDHVAGVRFRLYVGYKHTAPFIEDAVAAMHRDGIATAIALVLAPHYSSMSVQTYLDRARAAARVGVGPTIHAIPSWYQQAKFITYWATALRATLAQVPTAYRGKVAVIFSAHSLPQRILDMDDPYPRQVAETAERISTAVGLPNHEVAWQSAGQTAEPWIGPDIRDVTRELWDTAGYRAFVYCPIGFVSDHLEVLYDNDVQCRSLVDGMGGLYLRPPMPNRDPLFIAALRNAVSDALTQGVARAA